MTTTTVGYGDLVPESVAGRLIGFLLMLAGIGIIGILTANIASFFIEPPAGATGEDDEGSADETDVPDVALPTGDTSVEQLVTRMAALDAKLDRVLARLDADP